MKKKYCPCNGTKVFAENIFKKQFGDRLVLLYNYEFYPSHCCLFNHEPNIFLLIIYSVDVSKQGWHQVFSRGGMSLPTKGLKHVYRSNINGKNIR